MPIWYTFDHFKGEVKIFPEFFFIFKQKIAKFLQKKKK